jgi:hypothetical protein
MVEFAATAVTAAAPPSNGKSWRRDRLPGALVFISVSPPLVREQP